MPDVDASAAVYICPACGNPAFFCDKSNHGATDGPALHCRRFPQHNAFDPSEFHLWSLATDEEWTCV